MPLNREMTYPTRQHCKIRSVMITASSMLGMVPPYNKILEQIDSNFFRWFGVSDSCSLIDSKNFISHGVTWQQNWSAPVRSSSASSSSSVSMVSFIFTALTIASRLRLEGGPIWEELLRHEQEIQQMRK